MANCDATQFITNAGGFTASGLAGGRHEQNALLAWALMYSQGQTSDTLLKAQIVTSRNKLGALPPDQVRAGLINAILQFAVRSGQSSKTANDAQISANYLVQLDDDTLFMLFADSLCGLLSSLVP